MSLTKSIPFRRALALQSLSRNCYPAPNLVLRKPIFLIQSFSGGVLFPQTPVCFMNIGFC